MNKENEKYNFGRESTSCMYTSTNYFKGGTRK